MKNLFCIDTNSKFDIPKKMLTLLANGLSLEFIMESKPLPNFEVKDATLNNKKTLSRGKAIPQECLDFF
jgi:hypothetical protein